MKKEKTDRREAGLGDQASKNINRFNGLAGIYECARPALPRYPVEVILRYLGRDPDQVVDLGCGTGLSTLIWENIARRVTGVEANPDMLAVAAGKQTESVNFIQGLAHETGLAGDWADVLVCSQSFHWMEPGATLNEVNRILKPGGVFATIDYDWPPLSVWPVDRAFEQLRLKAQQLEDELPELQDTFIRYPKENHLSNIAGCGFFRYVREVLFANREDCSAERFFNMALSQGGLQAVFRKRPELIDQDLRQFQEAIDEYFPQESIQIDFSYRMRIGVK